jgi:hypothetical protein
MEGDKEDLGGKQRRKVLRREQEEFRIEVRRK